MRGFFGALLLTVGGLIALVSGGCTLFFVVPAVLQGAYINLELFLVVGGFPFIAGIVMVAGGIMMLRTKGSLRNEPP